MSVRLPSHVEDVYPLTPVQQGMLFHCLYSPAAGLYCDQLVCDLESEGELDLAVFEQAWRRVVGRHAALRTAMLWERRDQPLQVVLREVELPIDYRDCRELTPPAQEELLAALLDGGWRRGFDLARPPLLRVAVQRLGRREYRLLLEYHHLLMDAWSVPIVLRELLASYQGGLAGGSPELGDPRPFRDYVAWLQRQDSAAAAAFWREHLRGITAPTPLGAGRDHAPDPGQAPAPCQQELRLTEAASAALAECARGQRLTAGTVLQGCWAVLLHRYSGQLDVVYGLVVSGRPEELPGVESMVGTLVNTLPARAAIAPRSAAGGWLRAFQLRLAEMGQFAASSLVDIQGVSEVPRDLPLFHSILAIENTPVDPALAAAGAVLAPRQARYRTRTNYPLTVTATPARQLILRASHDRSRFEAAEVLRLLGHYATLLGAVAAAPETPLGDLPLLGAAERHQLLREWRPAPTSAVGAPAAPALAPLHQAFERQAAARGTAPAVGDASGWLSYAELDRRAGRLARRLRELGVGPESRVGLACARGTGLVVGVLGILKAGAAYVPLDTGHPRERLEWMLGDAGVEVLVGEEPHLSRLATPAARVTLGEAGAEPGPDHGAPGLSAGGHQVTEDGRGIAGAAAPEPGVEVPPAAAAYVIYTSGSTGRPKGVVVSHANVARLLTASARHYRFGPADVWTLFHSYAFDVSVWEMWGALLYGGRLVVPSFMTTRSPEAFHRLLVEERVTVLCQTPSAFRPLMAADAARPGEPLALRLVIFAGEALDVPGLAGWFERRGDRRPRLVNMYGITETTVHSSYRQLTAADARPGAPSAIGVALDDLAFAVLDPAGRPLPIGVPGELYVGGPGLARGYLGRPELTAERFVPDPTAAEPGARLYRSGDQVRLRPSGELDYLGRLDQQVKIRGFRVELGEIESALAAHPAVAGAAVLALPGAGGSPRLVAYVEPRPGEAWQQAGGLAALRPFLALRLPEHMLPALCVAIDKLPLTANGKLDRRALPPPEQLAAPAAAGAAAPRTPFEELVAGIWSEVLGLPRVGAEDDFFDLGGHSLLATQVVSRIREALGVELPLSALFARRTVAQLAQWAAAAVEERHQVSVPQLRPAPRGGELPLSYAQQQLWFVAQLAPGDASYNLPLALRLAGPLQPAALARALAAIVRRHEVLRTVFPAVDGKPSQRILPARVGLRIATLAGLPGARRQEETRRRLEAEARRPFDLAAGPLLRAVLLRLEDQESVLLLTLHHIVCDGWSLGVLVNEMATLYDMPPAADQTSPAAPSDDAGPAPPSDDAGPSAAGLPAATDRAGLPPLPVQYADFAVWQRAWLQGEVLDRLLAYWRRQLANLPQLRLPLDRPRLAVPSSRGAACRLALSGELTEALRGLARSRGMTLFVVLLAAFKAVLHARSGQLDVVVGSDVAGRGHLNLEPLIGFFVNQVVLRSDLSGDPSFEQLLRRVRETALAAYAHQDLPFDRLVEALRPARELALTPLFQAKLVLQNTPRTAPRLASCEVTPIAAGSGAVKFDLLLNLREAPSGLLGTCEYRSELMDHRTVAALLADYRLLLERVAAAPDTRLGALVELLAAAARERQRADEQALQQAAPTRLQRLRRKAVHAR